MSDSSRPHGLQPTRLLCPWDFPGKSTGVGCRCLLFTPTLFTKSQLWSILTFTVSFPEIFWRSKHKHKYVYWFHLHICSLKLTSSTSQLSVLFSVVLAFTLSKILSPNYFPLHFRKTLIFLLFLLPGLMTVRGWKPAYRGISSLATTKLKNLHTLFPIFFYPSLHWTKFHNSCLLSKVYFSIFTLKS